MTDRTKVTASDALEYVLGSTAWLASLVVLAIVVLHVAASVPQAPLAVLSAAYLFLVGVVALPAGRRAVEGATGQRVADRQWAVLGALFVGCHAVSFAFFFPG